MKKVIFGAAAAMALAGAGAQAANAQTMGFADLSYTHTDVDDVDLNTDTINLGGAVAAPIGGTGWNTQLNAHFHRTSIEDGPDLTMGDGAVHAYYSGSNWKLGGMLGVQDFAGEGIYSFGVDGQYNFSTVSLTGQIAYNNADNSGGNFWTEAVEGKWFAQEDFALSAHYTHLGGDDDSFVTDTNLYGVGAEYKFATSPISVFADYTRTDVDDSALFAADSNAFTIGVRYNFGDGTLHDRQNEGPSLLNTTIGFLL